MGVKNLVLEPNFIVLYMEDHFFKNLKKGPAQSVFIM